jgi:hypothetical protein
MEIWDHIKPHWGWLTTAAAGALGLLGEKAIRHRRSPSGDSWTGWIGRRWNIEKQNVSLKHQVKDLLTEIKEREASIERREAAWARERADLERYVTTLMVRLDRFSSAAQGIKTAHEDGLLSVSEPPSNGPTPPSATSSTSSKKSNG